MIMLAPGHRNEFMDCQNSTVRTAVLPIMNVMTHWDSTLELLDHAYQSHEFKLVFLQNPKYSDYRPHFTTQDKWTMMQSAMEWLRAFRYWTLWMSKRHTVILCDVITVYNDMFNHMHGMMRHLAKKKTPLKEDLFFVVKLAQQKLSKFYAEVTSTTGMHFISAHDLDPFRKVRLIKKWDQGMDINHEDETTYTDHYHEAFLKYMENGWSAKHRHVPVNTHTILPSGNLVPSAMASETSQSSFDPYDMPGDDEKYSMHHNGAATTPGWSNHAALLLTSARVFLNSPPAATKNCGQIHPNLNDYHSGPMEISSTFWIPDIINRWRQQEEMHSK